MSALGQKRTQLLFAKLSGIGNRAQIAASSCWPRPVAIWRRHGLPHLAFSKRTNWQGSLPSRIPSVQLARRTWSGRPILHDPHSHVWTSRAFKGAPVVTRLVRLDTCKPHLWLAKFAKRTTDDALLRKNFIVSHTAPFESQSGNLKSSLC